MYIVIESNFVTSVLPDFLGRCLTEQEEEERIDTPLIFPVHEQFKKGRLRANIPNLFEYIFGFKIVDCGFMEKSSSLRLTFHVTFWIDDMVESELS